MLTILAGTVGLANDCTRVISTHCSDSDYSIYLAGCWIPKEVCTPIVPIICVTITAYTVKALTWEIGDGYKNDCTWGFNTGSRTCISQYVYCTWTVTVEQCDGSDNIWEDSNFAMSGVPDEDCDVDEG